MWVIEDHLRPSGHIMPDHAGDRGEVILVLAPHDHLHINQKRSFSAQRGLDKYAGQARHPAVEILTVGTLRT
jgi:hypothetical protein